MRKEYDFTHGERGKFYRKNATMHLPIYLDDINLKFISEIAARKKHDINTVVNDLISKDHALIRALS